MRRSPLLATFALFVLTGCAPRLQQVVAVPEIQVARARLLRFDPPGLSVTPQAELSLQLKVRNPNPFGVRLQQVAGNFLLNGHQAAQFRLPNLAVAARGVSRERAVVDVAIDPATLRQLFAVATGRAVPFRVRGSFQLDAGLFGRPRFGPYTLLQGVIHEHPALLPPSFRFRADLSRLTVGAGGLRVVLALEVHNPDVLGYRLHFPLALRVGGAALARADFSGSVPALGSGLLYADFSLNPLAVPEAIARGELSFSLSGAPLAITPGVGQTQFGLQILTGGSAPLQK
jgi:LEA14-like dessication related protein